MTKIVEGKKTVMIKRASMIMMALCLLAFMASGCGSAAETPAKTKTVAAPASNVSIDIDSVAPDFTLTTLDGRQLKLSELRGKPVFLNFWATWCPPCVGEMPHFQSLYPKYKDKMHFLAVSIDREKSPVETFAKDKKLTFPIGTDLKQAVASLYRIEAVPTSFLLDKDGKIVAYHLGGMSAKELDGFLSQIK